MDVPAVEYGSDVTTVDLLVVEYGSKERNGGGTNNANRHAL